MILSVHRKVWVKTESTVPLAVVYSGPIYGVVSVSLTPRFEAKDTAAPTGTKTKLCNSSNKLESSRRSRHKK